jgi:hypothetical protein
MSRGNTQGTLLRKVHKVAAQAAAYCQAQLLLIKQQQQQQQNQQMVE